MDAGGDNGESGGDWNLDSLLGVVNETSLKQNVSYYCTEQLSKQYLVFLDIGHIAHKYPFIIWHERRYVITVNSKIKLVINHQCTFHLF